MDSKGEQLDASLLFHCLGREALFSLLGEIPLRVRGVGGIVLESGSLVFLAAQETLRQMNHSSFASRG